MDRQNVTLSVPKDVLVKAKLIAVKRQTSLSGLLTETLEDLVKADGAYAAARERQLRLMEEGLDLGTYGRPLATRDELHER